ncbi:MAG: hypothetical protein R3F34_00370 [Planctomycetota bacterium]
MLRAAQVEFGAVRFEPAQVLAQRVDLLALPPRDRRTFPHGSEHPEQDPRRPERTDRRERGEGDDERFGRGEDECGRHRP